MPARSPEVGVDKHGEFEDYHNTSQIYDQYRRPISLQSLRAAMEVVATKAGKAISDLVLLDVGCGTGNYLNELATQVGVAHGIEFNGGMLNKAKEKLASHQNVVLESGSVINIPKDSNSYDFVIMTQVIHHIAEDEQQRAFDEVARVLKPGGIFWIQTCFPNQQVDGFWWAAIIPQAAAKVSAHFPGEPLIRKYLHRSGFSHDVHIELEMEPLMHKKLYYDIEGPFNDTFRKGDSTWALSHEEELQAGLDWWRSQIDAGKAEDFLKAREELTSRIGQTVCVWAVKEGLVS